MIDPDASAETGAKRGAMSRRAILTAAAGAAIAAPFGFVCRARAQEAKRLKLAWMPTALCHIAVPVALHRGFFEKYQLNVESINWAGSTDLLLQSVSSGTADLALGMALRWIKPLEAGFDVKLTGATHGGCMNILAARNSGLTNLQSLRGKRIGVGDIAGVDRNFFAIALSKRGIDPVNEIDWRQFPPDLLGVAVEKGEVDAISTSDPLAYKLKQSHNLVEVATNLVDEYADRACCVIGVRGSLYRADRPTAVAASKALIEAAQWSHENPDDAAAAYAPYAPKENPADLGRMLRTLTNHRHPIGEDFKTEIITYAEELKVVEVLKRTTDTKKFADRVVVDIN
ncbi:ABC-type nitrate/sulfonate/bicarbonate transport systems [Blastochloris viridis]|uniref:ABC-type nitrate/sulfonate/bicarbonate transport systems n=3 Tax=Blastochloris viridis TaxID=1079 RepID=A0A182D4A3_BLAVI|nr:ABC-type nitrate/sulfonate/bicarbonate transport systems [Blastochloris viridis]